MIRYAHNPRRRRSLDDLGLTVVDEYGVHFETGEPTSFDFIHNTERSPRPGPDDRFQQKIEPAGYYCVRQYPGYKPTSGWVTGTAWVKPIVLHESLGPGLYGPDSWKARLSRYFGNKKRKALSAAIERAGFNAVVTVGRQGNTSEIVLLDSASVAMD